VSHAETRRPRRGGAEIGLIGVNSAPSASPREMFPFRVLALSATKTPMLGIRSIVENQSDTSKEHDRRLGESDHVQETDQKCP